MQEQPLFGKPVSELIRQRHSCRTFTDREIEAGKWRRIREFLGAFLPPFSNRVRVDVIDKEKVKAENFFSGGIYGQIKGARFFIAAIIPKGAEMGWEDIGFSLEAVILKCTELGLGSCWIGGVFDRKRFGRQLAVTEAEILPAVVAVGYAAAKPSWRDSFVRRGARGDQRQPADRLFFLERLARPLKYEDFPEFREILENVRLAPSASNKQPWRIILHDDLFHFFLDRDKAYRRLMPAADLQRIDMGIAVCHFELSRREAGMAGEWTDKNPGTADLPGNYEYIASFRLS